MKINTELRCCPAPILNIPVTWVRPLSLKHAFFDSWQMGEGQGSLSHKEAEVNINLKEKGNGESGFCLELELFVVFMELTCFDITTIQEQ